MFFKDSTQEKIEMALFEKHEVYKSTDTGEFFTLVVYEDEFKLLNICTSTVLSEEDMSFLTNSFIRVAYNLEFYN